MENKETMYLWVLDYNDKATYKYAVAIRENPNDYRKMLRDVGHDLAKIEWMLSPYYEQSMQATICEWMMYVDRLQNEYEHRSII